MTEMYFTFSQDGGRHCTFSRPNTCLLDINQCNPGFPKPHLGDPRTLRMFALSQLPAGLTTFLLPSHQEGSRNVDCPGPFARTDSRNTDVYRICLPPLFSARESGADAPGGGGCGAFGVVRKAHYAQGEIQLASALTSA